jgi:ABC-type amino acid transport substrate-binding protein
MKKRINLLLGLSMALVIIALSGCSSGASQQAGADTPVYIVGTEPTFPPFEMPGENPDEIIGFDIDLIKAIAEDQGFEVEIQKLGFDGLIMAVQSGNIDIAASGMSITPERLKEVDFSDPYIDAGLAIAIASGNQDITGKDDLKGKSVAVQIGTTGAEKAQQLMDEGLIAEVKTFDTVDVVIMELISGGVDAVINDLPVTQAYMAAQPGKIKIVGETLASDSYGFAIKKGNTELLNKINAGLKNVMEKGIYDELIEKYF